MAMAVLPQVPEESREEAVEPDRDAAKDEPKPRAQKKAAAPVPQIFVNNDNPANNNINFNPNWLNNDANR